MNRDSAAVELALSQHGVIGLDQARALGFSEKMIKHRVRKGVWKRNLPRVLVVGAAPETWHQRAHAALLWAGEGSALCRRSVAFLLGWTFKEPKVIQVVIPHKRILKAPKGIAVHRSRRLEGKQRRQHNGFWICSTPRTLLDLAPQKDIEEVLDSAIHVAANNLLWTKQYLRRKEAPRLPGRGRLRRLLNERSPSDTQTDSRLEARFKQLLKEAGLPAVHHAVLVDRHDQFIMESDFSFPRERVVVEVDGPHHYGAKAVKRRAEVQQRLAAVNWLLIPVLRDDIRRDVAKVIENVRCALAGRKLAQAA